MLQLFSYPISVVDVEGSDDGPSEAKRRKVEDDDDKDEEKNGVSKPEKSKKPWLSH